MSNAFDLHWDRGFKLHDEGKLLEAITEWREASRLDPEDGYVLHNIGLALWKMGRQEEAIAEWREAVRLEPDYESPHISLAHALSVPGYSPEALAAVRAAILLCPNTADLYVCLGDHLRVKASQSRDKSVGREAWAAFQRAVDLDPSDSYALLRLGKLQYWLGNKQIAIKNLKAAVAADPTNVEAYFTLAGCQICVGHLRDWQQTMTMIWDLPPSKELNEYHMWQDRLWKRVEITLFFGVGIAALLLWRRWQRR